MPEVKIAGSGATLPARLYESWAAAFNQRAEDGIEVHYEPTGSAAGVQALITGKSDFGATDTRLSAQERELAGPDVVEIPATGGLIVVAFNLPGVTTLKLARSTLCKLFSAQITRWNHPEIVASNPDVTLTDLRVLPVHRLDGSGTTSMFTEYLAGDVAWPRTIGSGRSIAWPGGAGAFGNEGMGVRIKHNEGAVGYVEYGVAKQVKLAMAALQTTGGFVEPTVAAGREALLSGNGELLSNVYPLATLSWLLINKRHDDPKRSAAVADFIRYGLGEGQVLTESLGYLPLPAQMAQGALAELDKFAPNRN